MAFTGFAPAALQFYDQLEANNTRAWWLEHKSTYDEQVREPMRELLDAVSDDFGPARIFRPNRDVRFSKNKDPYKTGIAAMVQLEDAVGYYIQFSTSGLFIGGGWYAPLGSQLARFRASVDSPSVVTIEKELATLKRARPPFVLNGAPLKTRPRGVPADHPRIELLRFTQLTLMRDYGVPDWLNSAKVITRLRNDWRAITPALEWLADHVGPESDPADE
ncbi:MAG: DUF2461 domain-containing protein [Actinomycetes bacterium]